MGGDTEGPLGSSCLLSAYDMPESLHEVSQFILSTIRDSCLPPKALQPPHPYSLLNPRGDVSCPRSHVWLAMELGFKPKFVFIHFLIPFHTFETAQVI